MTEEKNNNLKIDKKIGIIWVIIIMLLVVGGQIAFSGLLGASYSFN